MCSLHYEKFPDGSVKCIEEEIPFAIPQGWEWIRLNTIASFSGGKTPSTSKSEFWGHDYLWITSKDMKSKYITESKLCLSEKGAETMQLLDVDTLLFVARSGILRHSFPVAIIKKPATINQDIKAITLYLPELSEFLYYYLKGIEKRILLKYSKSGTTVENINFDLFKNTPVPIPPTSEQHRIVLEINKILSFTSSIENNKVDLQSLIQQTKSKILDLAIRGKLVPQDPNDEPASVLLERIRAEKEEHIKLGKIKRDKKESVILRGEDNSYYDDIPNNWATCYLSELFNVCSAKRVRQSDWRTEGVPFYRAREIVKLADNGYVDNDLFISEEHFQAIAKDNGVPQPGDLMVSGVGTIGKIYIVKESDKFYYKDASVLCFENRKNVIDSKFAKYMLESDFLQGQMKDNSKGTTVDTITISSAMLYICILPPLAEQIRIVTAIESAFAQLDQIANAIA